MSEFIVDVTTWVQQQPVWIIYTGILLVAYLENLLPPVPGDLLVVFGGYLISTGELTFFGVITLATIGGTVGFMTMYAFGRRLGPGLLHGTRYKWIPRRRLRRAMDWFGKIGYRLILANRFLSGLRSVISLTVGIIRTKWLLTTLCAGISSVLWVSVLAFLGFSLGENWEVVQQYLSRYGQFMGLAIVLFILIQLLRFWMSTRQNTEGDEETGGGAVENLHG